MACFGCSAKCSFAPERRKNTKERSTSILKEGHPSCRSLGSERVTHNRTITPDRSSFFALQITNHHEKVAKMPIFFNRITLAVREVLANVWQAFKFFLCLVCHKIYKESFSRICLCGNIA